jgi:hypothetical protein
MAIGSISIRRIGALLVVGLMVAIPALWIGWSLDAASETVEANRIQSETLDSLKVRLAALNAGSGAAEAQAASVYLPGETAAIAGAALQTLVSNTVAGAGGRVAETEIARPEGEAEGQEAEPGAVSLRVSFDTDIAGLQRIVFELETGAPILMVQAVTVEAKDATATAATESPMLSVVLLVRGYREA